MSAVNARSLRASLRILLAPLRCAILGLLTLLAGCAAETPTEVVAQDRAAVAEAWKPAVADYAGVIRNAQGRIDVPTMIARLKTLHVTTYAFLVWGWRYQATPFYTTDFDDLSLFVPAAEAAGIETWAYLPSPREMDLFAPPPCRANYTCWGEKLGTLAKAHPKLTTIVVDDFFSKPNAKDLGPEVAAAMRDAARANAPSMRFFPIAYFTNAMNGLLGRDYASVLDGVVFVDLNRSIAASDAFFPDQLAQMNRVLRSPVETLSLHVPASADAQAGELASLSKTGRVVSGPHTVTFGVGDDLFGKTGEPAVAGGEGARMVQLYVSGNKAWERDLNAPPLPTETPGYQRVKVDIDRFVKVGGNATITFRVSSTRSQGGMPAVDAQVYDVGVIGVDLSSSPTWKKNIVGTGAWDAEPRTHRYHARVVEMVYASTLAGGFTPDKAFIVHSATKAHERMLAGTLDGVMTYQLDKVNTFPGSTFAELAGLYASWGY